jgi:hypothetical protein
LIHIEGGKECTFTRNGYDWSGCYEPIVKACVGLDYAGMAFMAFSEKLYDVLSERAQALPAADCPIKGVSGQPGCGQKSASRSAISATATCAMPASGRSLADVLNLLLLSGKTLAVKKLIVDAMGYGLGTIQFPQSCR